MNHTPDTPETIPQYLARMRVKDMGKHGPESLGWRTTREVADFMGMSRTAALLQLNELADADEAIAAHDGSSYIWRAPGPEDVTPSLPAAVGAYLAALDAERAATSPTICADTAAVGLHIEAVSAARSTLDEALAALRLAYAQVIPETITGDPT